MEKESIPSEQLSTIESFAGRKFKYSRQIEKLLQLEGEKEKLPKVTELFFLSKFVSNSWNILDRLGGEIDETKKIKSEFAGSLEKIQKLIGELGAGDEQLAHLSNVATIESMKKLRDFIYELSWVQNYKIDRKDKQ